MFGIDDAVTAGIGIFNGIMQRHQFDKWFKWWSAILIAFWCGGVSTVGFLHAGGMNWGLAITGGLITGPSLAVATWVKSPLSKDVQLAVTTDMKDKMDATKESITVIKGEGK